MLPTQDAVGGEETRTDTHSATPIPGGLKAWNFVTASASKWSCCTNHHGSDADRKGQHRQKEKKERERGKGHIAEIRTKTARGTARRGQRNGRVPVLYLAHRNEHILRAEADWEGGHEEKWTRESAYYRRVPERQQTRRRRLPPRTNEGKNRKQKHNIIHKKTT